MATGILTLPVRPRVARSKSTNIGLIRSWPLGVSRSAAEAELFTGNDGTWSGTGDHVASSERGSVGNFPSKDDYISLGTGWSAFVRADCTVMLWVNILSMSNGSKTIIGGVSDGYSPLFLVTASTTDAGNGLLVCWQTISVTLQTDGLALNTWHRLVLTRSGNTIALYKNGVYVTQGTAGTTGADDTKELRIGGSAAWNTAYAMQASDVRFYNRALSATEIAQDYAIGSRSLTVLRKPYRKIVTTFQFSAVETQAGLTTPGQNQVDTLSAGFPDGDFTITATKGETPYTTGTLGAACTAGEVQSALEAVLPAGATVVVDGGPHDTTDITMTWGGTWAEDNGPYVTWEYQSSTYTNKTQDGIATSYINEQQTLAFSDLPLSGTFTLTLEGDTTAAIPWNATAEQIAAAIEAAAAGVEVTVITSGVLADGDTIELSFGGTLQGTDIGLLTADLSELSTIGSVPLIGMGISNGAGILC